MSDPIPAELIERQSEASMSHYLQLATDLLEKMEEHGARLTLWDAALKLDKQVREFLQLAVTLWHHPE